MYFLDEHDTLTKDLINKSIKQMYLKQNCFKTESHYAALTSSEPAYYLDQAGLKQSNFPVSAFRVHYKHVPPPTFSRQQ